MVAVGFGGYGLRFGRSADNHIFDPATGRSEQPARRDGDRAARHSA
jgi:hypothetical protein